MCIYIYIYIDHPTLDPRRLVPSFHSLRRRSCSVRRPNLPRRAPAGPPSPSLSLLSSSLLPPVSSPCLFSTGTGAPPDSLDLRWETPQAATIFFQEPAAFSASPPRASPAASSVAPSSSARSPASSVSSSSSSAALARAPRPPRRRPTEPTGTASTPSKLLHRPPLRAEPPDQQAYASRLLLSFYLFSSLSVSSLNFPRRGRLSAGRRCSDGINPPELLHQPCRRRSTPQVPRLAAPSPARRSSAPGAACGSLLRIGERAHEQRSR